MALELKRELIRIFGPELAGGLSLRDELRELVGPVALEPRDAFPDQSGVCIELGGGGSEEAAAGEDALLDVGEELFAQRDPRERRGATTSASTISPVSIVASCNSSLKPKWA